MTQTEVAVARLEQQMQGFIEHRTIRDQQIDSKFDQLGDQLHELSNDLRAHAAAAVAAATTALNASQAHDESDRRRFARLEWAALLGENWKKLGGLFFTGMVVAVLLGSHGPELITDLLKMLKG